MKSFHIEYITPKQFRFQTIPNFGDYFEDPDAWKVQILDTGNRLYNTALTLHELCEIVLCIQRGIPFDSIDKWDLSHPNDDDPGMLPESPYYQEHIDATILERMFICLAGERWRDYEACLASFYPNGPNLKSERTI